MILKTLLKSLALLCPLVLTACEEGPQRSPTTQMPAPDLREKTTVVSDRGLTSVDVQPIAKFDLPYSFAVLPSGDLIVLDTIGGLRIVGGNGAIFPEPVTGLPTSFIGPYDIILDPHYATNHRIFVSYGERGRGDPSIPSANVNLGLGYNLAVLSGVLTLDDKGGRLDDVKIIWRQLPRTMIGGMFGGHMVFSPDGRYLFITSGDRQTFAKAQDMKSTMGKIVRIFPNGKIPRSNPFYRHRETIAPEIWSSGHRNQYGLAFDKFGVLWENEMGPQGGDELNLVEPTGNYGWPVVSWGDHYGGSPIQKPAAGDGLIMPVLQWTPVIAPSGMIIYSGGAFPSLDGRAIIGGLKSEGLVVVKLDGRSAVEEDRINLGTRIRDVRQGLNGEMWVMEDRPSSRLLKLTPARQNSPVANVELK